MELASFIGAAEWADFRRAFLGKKAIVRPEAECAGRFQSLWAEWELDALCRFTLAPHYEEFRLVSRGKKIPVATYTDRQGAFRMDAFRQLRASGASVALGNFESYSNRALALTRQLEAEFRCPVQVNLYATPGHQQGLGAHVDPHDVLILQIQGEKVWDIYASSPSSGLEGGSELAKPVDGTAGAVQTVVLKPGGWLFLPKGTRHEVRNRADEPSVHFTIGFHPLTWGAILQQALEQARVSSPVLNEAILPEATIHEADEAVMNRLKGVLSFVHLAEHSVKYYAGFPMLAQLLPASAIASGEALGQIDETTRLQWREDATVLPARGMGVEVNLPYRRFPLALRENLAAVVKEMQQAPAFCPQHVNLENPPSAVLLCKFLVSAGLLRRNVHTES